MTPDEQIYTDKAMRRRLDVIESSSSSITEEETQRVRDKILNDQELSASDCDLIERAGVISGGNAELCFLASAGPTGNITIKRLIGVPLED